MPPIIDIIIGGYSYIKKIPHIYKPKKAYIHTKRKKKGEYVRENF